MIFKRSIVKHTAFFGATALSLILALPAFADGNTSYVLQQGDDNSGSVSQSGEGGNMVGTAGQNATQDGDNNSFTFEQIGLNNRISAHTRTEFLQKNDRNQAVIRQGQGAGSEGNVVKVVTQTGLTSGATVSNVLTIDQARGASQPNSTLGGNRIAKVSQTRSGGTLADLLGANSATLTQVGGGNHIGEVGSSGPDAQGVFQDGAGHNLSIIQTGRRHRIGQVVQNGIAQRATITQTGPSFLTTEGRNWLQSAVQEGTGNQLTLSFTGTHNGGDATGPSDWPNLHGTLDSAFTRFVQATASQSGELNSANLSFSGNENLFALVQDGRLNITQGTVLGSNNAVAIGQDGTLNDTNTVIAGNRNHLVILQDGTANDADALITGNDNHAQIAQNGERNTGLIDVNTGDGNTANILQNASGLGANTATLLVRGGSDGNSLSADQTANGLGARNTTTQTATNGADGNSATVVQSATARNLGSARNDAPVTFDGASGNTVGINQTANANGIGASARNTAPVTLSAVATGNTVGITQEATASGFGASALNTATVGVVGHSNRLTIGQIANANGWGASAANSATQTVLGSGNVLTTNQTGSNSSTLIANGSGNALSNTQTGSNTATLTANGSGNALTSTQTGTNTATLTANGNGNLVNSRQDVRNNLVLTIWGDNNNNIGRGFSAGLPAALVAGSLNPGDVIQDGTLNTVNLEIGTSATDTASGNLFAFSQTGNNNAITGRISGSMNEVAVVQTGNANAANFSQIGVGNILGVSQ